MGKNKNQTLPRLLIHKQVLSELDSLSLSRAVIE